MQSEVSDAIASGLRLPFYHNPGFREHAATLGWMTEYFRHFSDARYQKNSPSFRCGCKFVRLLQQCPNEPFVTIDNQSLPSRSGPSKGEERNAKVNTFVLKIIPSALFDLLKRVSPVDLGVNIIGRGNNEPDACAADHFG